MRDRSRVLRARFLDEVIRRLDGLAVELKGELPRRITRAALMRALVVTSMEAVESRQAIVKHLAEDRVRRGRARGEKRGP